MISWALAHGLAILTRDRALQAMPAPAHHAGTSSLAEVARSASRNEQQSAAEVAYHLIDIFTRQLTEDRDPTNPKTAATRHRTAGSRGRP
jgi:hypothetical protein